MQLFLKNQGSDSASVVPMNVVGRDMELTASLAATVERRLAYALGRLGSNIRRVHVRLSDSRARKGEHMTCEIRILLPWRDALTVAASDARLEVAITKAAHAAARSLDDVCKRRRGA